MLSSLPLIFPKQAASWLAPAVADGMSSFSTTSISLALIRAELQALHKKVDKLLKEPMESAIQDYEEGRLLHGQSIPNHSRITMLLNSSIGSHQGRGVQGCSADPGEGEGELGQGVQLGLLRRGPDGRHALQDLLHAHDGGVRRGPRDQSTCLAPWLENVSCL